MTDKRLEEIRARHSLFESSRILYEEKNQHRLVSDSAVLHADIGALLDFVDALQAKFDILLPAAQQTSSLLEAIRMDTPWMVSPGVRELYQAVDQDLTAAIEAALND